MNVINECRYAITLTEITAESESSSKKFEPGSILKIQKLEDDGTVLFVEEVAYDKKFFKTPRTYHVNGISGLLFFKPDIYKFVVAIRDDKQRIEFCQSTERQQFLSQLKVNDVVKIPYGSFGLNDNTFRRAIVKYIGTLNELGPGYHFILSVVKGLWTLVSPANKDITIPDSVIIDCQSIILSPEYILEEDAKYCPDVELFYIYRGKNYDVRMSRQPDGNDKLTKSQAYAKRNSSNVFESASNKNTIKTEKSFNVDGKEVYVIDGPSDTDNADVQIVENNSRYEDRTAVLLTTKWPECAGPQFEMLNGKSEEATNNTNSSSSSYPKQVRTTPRTKSSNLLDHFNQDSRNANRDTFSQSGSSRYSLRKPETRQPVYYDNDINNSIDVDEPPEEFTKIPGSTLGIDAMVTVETGSCPPCNGVIRAIFKIGSVVMVGVELEDFMSFAPLNLTDGTFSGHRFFQCQNGKALFIEAECCHKDNRFSDDFVAENKVFGHPESPIVTEKIPPLSLKNLQELEEVIGESKGIQGHNNSCYLDATLFSMFTFAQCFDSLLYRSVEPKDIKHYDEVRAILRDEIVHPLRKHHFVRADRVLKLREKLEEISTMTGLTNEEKDPEEFMNILMAQTLKADPYLKFNSGQDAFYYQLFVEKNEELKLPNVQQLFEQSFKTSNIKLREVPPCLIIQMPRFGKNYKMYPRIVPSQVLDITDVVEGQPPACNVDGRLAAVKCIDCQDDFCSECFSKMHYHQNQNHKKVDIHSDFPTLLNHQTVPRIHMDLFAVVCIETSHYVSFVKAGELPDAPWLFFDSMSDRRGGQHGYNIPSMVSVPALPEWLSEEGARKLHESTPKDKLLPPFAKRLLCDAYMCMYVSRDVSMYK